MQAIKFAPIAMLLTLLLGALPAAAGGYGYPRGDHGLERLAFELARSTGELQREVAQSPRLRGPVRFRARHTFARLDRNATAFHRRVRREGVNDRDTQRAFRQLQASFRAANARLPLATKRHGVRDDMRRVTRLMVQLETRMARTDDHRDDHRYGARAVARPGFRIAGRFEH